MNTDSMSDTTAGDTGTDLIANALAAVAALDPAPAPAET